MVKLNKKFFLDGEVLFVGYSSGKWAKFSRRVYYTLQKNGIKVYPLNKKQDVNFDIKVYRSISELPKVPRCAYLVLNNANNGEIVRELAEKGVRRILFQWKFRVDQETIKECEEKGIEIAFGCPMMLFGSGRHKVHGFFAGVH